MRNRKHASAKISPRASSKTHAEKRYWLDKKRNVDKLIGLLVLVCIGLLCADFFYHKHVHFAFEDWFGFYAWYGFISCVVLVLAAKQLRKIVKRDEDYYD